MTYVRYATSGSGDVKKRRSGVSIDARRQRQWQRFHSISLMSMCRWDKRRLSRSVKTLFFMFAMFPVYSRTRPVVTCCHGATIEICLTVDVARRVSLAMSPQTGGSKPGKDFESVELGELDGSEEEQQPQREKVPRRIIHFSSGETMEEYSTDEEEDQEPEKKDLLSSPVDAVRKSADTVVIVM